MTKESSSSFYYSGDNAEPQFEVNNDQSDSAGGSNDERSDDEAGDGGENDKDGDRGSDGEEDEDGGEDEDRDDGNANAGWAEAMAKILGKKTPESKTSILVKNKELDKMKEKERQEQLERKKKVITTVKDSVLYTVKNNKTLRVKLTLYSPFVF